MILRKIVLVIFLFQSFVGFFSISKVAAHEKDSENLNTSPSIFLGEFISQNGGSYTFDPHLSFLKWPGQLYISGCLGSGWGREHGEGVRTVLVGIDKDFAILEVGKINGPFEEFNLGAGQFWVANILGYWEFDKEYFGSSLTLTNGGQGTAAAIGPIAEFLSKQEFSPLVKKTLEEVLELSSSKKCPPPHFFFRWLVKAVKERQDWAFSKQYNSTIFENNFENSNEISILGFFEDSKGTKSLNSGIYEILFEDDFLFEVDQKGEILALLRFLKNNTIKKNQGPICFNELGTREIHVISLDFSQEKAGTFGVRMCTKKGLPFADLYLNGEFFSTNKNLAEFLLTELN